MVAFSNRIHHIEIAIDPADCDGAVFVLGHFGEDVELIRETFRQNNSKGDCSIVVFTHDLQPRQQFSSRASISAALPAIEARLKTMCECPRRKSDAEFWVGLCEGLCVSYGRGMLKLAELS